MNIYPDDVLDICCAFLIVGLLLLFFFAPFPWLSAPVIWRKTDIDNHRPQFENSLLINYTSFTRRLAMDTAWAPFGKVVRLNSNVTYDNGSELLWTDYFFVSSTFELTWLNMQIVNRSDTEEFARFQQEMDGP